MIGVDRLTMTPAQARALPLPFRVLYFKDLPPPSGRADPYRIEGQGALVATAVAFEKPVSRT